MSHVPRFALWMTTLLFSLCAAVSEAAQEGQSPDAIYEVDLSADGKHYAILRQYEGQRIIAIYNADDASKPPLAVGLGDLPTRGFAWGGDEHVLVQVSGEREGLRTNDGLQTMRFSRWMIVDRETGELHTVFGNEIGGDYSYFIGSAGDLISTLPEKPGHALFARASVSVQVERPSRLQQGSDEINYSLQELNLSRKRARQTEKGNEDTIDWVVNKNGDAIARIDSPNEDRIVVFARPSGEGGFKQVAEFNFAESPYSDLRFYGAALKNGAIQALVTEDSGAQKLVEFDLQTGAFNGLIYEASSGRIDSVLYDPRRASAYAAISSDGVRHFYPEDEAVIAKLENAVPGSTMLVLSKSADGERMLVQAFQQGGKTDYYFFDAPSLRLELIATN